MGARASRRKTDESLLARFHAATEAARRVTLRKVNAADPAYEDFAPLSYWRERWHDLKLQQRFLEKFIWIRDGFDANRLVQLQLTDLQKDLHFNLSAHKRVSITKGRGAQSTRYWLAVKFANAVVNSGVALRIVPHESKVEDELFSDLQIFYENLPDHLRPECRYYSKELIHFHDPEKGVLDSRITTLLIPPGREAMGRGQTISDLLVTETPFWFCDTEKAMKSLMQSLRGGSIVDETTAGGMEWHYKVFQQGQRNEAGWVSKFYPWYWSRNYRLTGAWFEADEDQLFVRYESKRALLSDKDLKIAKVIFRHLRKLKYVSGTDWQLGEVAEYMAWRAEKILEIGPQAFAVDYPENKRDCFEQSGRPLISGRYLNVTCRTSEPVEGREYGIGVDVSVGLQNGDASVIQIVDLTTGRQVLEEELRIAPDLLALKIAEHCDNYNRATLVIERNGPGIATINKLLDLGYEDRIYKYVDAATARAIEDGRKDAYEAMERLQFGFPTTVETKPLIGIALEEAIRTGRLGISSEAFCEEAKNCAWKDNRSWEAKGDKHDDRVVALALVNFACLTEHGAARGFVGVLPEFGAI